jgi:hypothetical protein
MRFRELLVVCVITAFTVCTPAQNVTGMILIKKKITKPSVTAAVSVYQRGTAVKLGKDDEADPLVNVGNTRGHVRD